jgi:uncharacterized protein
MDFEAARAFAVKRLNTEVSIKCYYHNVGHTLDVCRAVDFLTLSENIDQTDTILLKTAAFFHDIGMIDNYFQHEKESVTLLRNVLPGYGYTKEEIEKVSRLILVTQLVEQPKDIIEQIICDADLDYLGREDYFMNAERLRMEWAALGICHYTKREWIVYQIKFMDSHRYYTLTARNKRNKGKNDNIKKLEELLLNN